MTEIQRFELAVKRRDDLVITLEKLQVMHCNLNEFLELMADVSSSARAVNNRLELILRRIRAGAEIGDLAYWNEQGDKLVGTCQRVLDVVMRWKIYAQ